LDIVEEEIERIHKDPDLCRRLGIKPEKDMDNKDEE